MSKKKDIDRDDSHPEDRNGHHFPWSDDEEEEDEEGEGEILFTDELDHEILMHRDAHFAGDFQAMYNYYMEDHIGINPEFEIERIQYLAQIEQELGKDLAPYILTGPEAEKVAKARKAYRILKKIYEVDEENNSYPKLLADLILSEEEDPEAEIEAIVAQGKKILPELLQIIKSEDAYDTLFPGYGYAPFLAIQCLGKIGDPQSIVPLFEIIGKDSIFEEDVILEAFYEIGEPAKEFLLKTLKSRPITQDNVNAAYALSAFAEEDVSIASLNQLLDPHVREKPLLSQYLLCNCEQLQDIQHKNQFISLSKDPSVSKELRFEMKKIQQDWKMA